MGAGGRDSGDIPRWGALLRVAGRLLRRAVVAAGAVSLGVLLVLGGRSYLAVAAADLRAPAAAPVFLDRYGERIVAGPGDLQAYRPLDAISPHLRRAVVAMEDVRFWRHPGIDPIGIARAYWANRRQKGPIQGASTITQQLARTVFLTPERTIVRKIREAALALALEARYNKEHILELYLNRVYFGEGANGAEAAARLYFGKSAADLTLPEAALLAGLLPAPNRFSPFRNPSLALERRSLVLRRMAQLGIVTPEEAEEAASAELRLAPRGGDAAGYFIDYVTERLVQSLGPQLTYHGRLRVMTTLDPDVQRAAARALAASGYQGAVVVLDLLSGDILAMAGGRDYRESQFNRAVHARRQPGSAFKPIVYAAALERHWAPNSLLADEERAYGDYRPGNWDGRYHGRVTMQYSLIHSLNAASVWLLSQIGPRAAVAMAQRLGLTHLSGRDMHLALALGGLRTGVSPLQLAEAYTAFATGGVLRRSRSVLHVQGPDGREWRVSEGGAFGSSRVLSPQVAYLITDMLRGVVEHGTGTAARLSVPAAGKTGSTNDNRDAWFVGYTSRYLAAVYVGYDDNRPLPGGGGALAAPIWRRVMEAVTVGGESGEFPVPRGIVRGISVDPYTGLRAGPGCPDRYSASFLRGTEPREWAPCTGYDEGEEGGGGADAGSDSESGAPETEGEATSTGSSGPEDRPIPEDGIMPPPDEDTPAEGGRGWLFLPHRRRETPREEAPEGVEPSVESPVTVEPNKNTLGHGRPEGAVDERDNEETPRTGTE